MSGRTSARQRSKSARAQAAEAAAAEEEEANEMLATRKRRKRNLHLKERSETPNSRNGSRLSTPASSRGGSRSPTPTPKSGRKKTTPISRVNNKKPGRRVGSKNGSRRASSSRSSSVTSNTKPSRGRPCGTVPPIKLKIKTKVGRGYNPALVNYKESEYHYGSDFEDNGDETDGQTSKSEESSEEETESTNEEDDFVDSDVEFGTEPIARPSTPIPFWLREDENIPELHLPASSQDLLIPDNHILKACSVYEVLRHYSILLRLSPFRFEDFCAALSSEDQSNLLSEIHIALLKSIVRAEEKDGVQFGPLDYKDSINSILFFMDSFTWPESLKLYLFSDPVGYALPLKIFEKNKEYPLAAINSNNKDLSIENRISMLSFLADQFLTTTAVRDDIVNEGRQAPEDHCRICHRLGDMIVCEQCSGIYHVTCLDPPLDDVPEDDWQCYVCQANQVSGVTDVISEKERLGELHRHESLGIDRAGNKYWFICRRLIVEKRDGDGVIAYYTTCKQLEEVLNSIDPKNYEHDLSEAIHNIRDDIEENMKLTESITKEKKPVNRQSYLELENDSIEKIQKAREEAKVKELEDKKRIEGEKEKMAKVEMDKKREEEEIVLAEEEEKKRKQRENRLKKREEKRGDSWISGDDDVSMNDSDMSIKVKEENLKEEINDDNITSVKPDINTMKQLEDITEIKSEIKPEVKDEIDSKSFDKKPGDSLLASVSHKPTTRTQTGSLPVTKMFEDDMVNELRLNERITRSTLHHISSGTLYFKLGQENTFRSYINQYTTNPAALTKVQSNDERVKRTHMSHKFSLTDAAAFKWIGTLYGNRSQLVNTLRQTMIQLEKEISVTFMHPNWALLRKPWIGAVSQSVTPRDFARALTVIKCCIKPCILLNVWKESLGHTQFKKITSQMRDDKKKGEKRERKEREEDEERLRPWMAFVKYTLGLKHQVSKQKGEEYRAHGQNGWLWLSSSRNFAPSDSNKLGLRAGAYRLAVKYTDIRDGSFKIVLMEPNAFKYLLSKQNDKENKVQENGDIIDQENQSSERNDNADKLDNKVLNESQKSDEKPPVEKKKLEQALRNAKLEWQVADDDMFSDVIDVQAGLSNPTRILYPKVAKTTKVLDHFLDRRMKLKELERRRIELKTGIKPIDEDESKDIKKIEKTNNEDSIVDIEGESDTKTAVTSNLTPKLMTNPTDTSTKPVKPSISASRNTFITESKATILKVIEDLKVNCDELPELNKQFILKCYSAMCFIDTNSCYSVTCPKKTSKEPSHLSKAIENLNSISIEAKKHGVDITNNFLKITSKYELIENLKQVLDILSSQITDKLDESTSVISNITISTSTTTTSETTSTVTTMLNGDIDSVKTSKAKTSIESKTDLKNEHGTVTTATAVIKAKTQTIEETVSKEGETSRIYSSKDTTGRLYLKRIQSVADMKRQGKVVRYPLAPNFYSKARKKRNILLLAKHDVKHMARKYGISNCEGFNYNAKGNNQVWPYPCPRPFFHTSWSYRTSSSEAIQSVGLQLKILWACIRWDDMNSKSMSADGKHQVTTDNAITTTEILKHRNTGRFLENTQYFQRKVTIPLNVPSRPRPTSPIRSGLRKRKRAESPTQSEPQLNEQWIDEEKLELWEIRAYKDRLEREKYASITRGRSDTVVKGPDRYDPSSYTSNMRRKTDSCFDKDELEKGYRKDPSWEPESEQRGIRRESSVPRRFNKIYDPKPNSPSSIIMTPPSRSPAGIGSPSTPTIIRRITNPDGSVSVVRTAGVRPIAPTLVSNINSAGVSPITPPAKKVFISKDGKVIGTQLIQQTPNGPRIITPSSIRPGVASPSIIHQSSPSSNISTVQTASSPQQKVQIVRSADGKIQVRGLLPGQQLVQMPDGRLQIFSAPASSTVANTTATTTTVAPGPSRVVIQSPQTQTSLGMASNFSSPTVGSKVLSTGVSQVVNSPNQIIAQQLPPGAQIPTGMTAFVSGGKTYIIPKTTPAIPTQPNSTITVASATNSTVSSTPTVVSNITNNTLSNKSIALSSGAPTTTTATPPTTPKQMVEVKALGPNVVQFKGNQMIVSGPDVQQAQLIAKQLSSGAARLATLGGKQVLISTSAMANTIPATTSLKSGSELVSSNMLTTNTSCPTSTSSVVSLQPNIKQLNTEGAKTNDIKTSSCATESPVDENLKATSLNVISKDGTAIKTGATVISGEASQTLTDQGSTQATAQLLQTPQGPRIILQGIQAANIPKDQLLSIQQQVKTQLLKAQAEAKKDNKIPPTKIAIKLPPSMQNKLQPEISPAHKTENKEAMQSSSVLIPSSLVNSQLQNNSNTQQQDTQTKTVSTIGECVSKSITLQQHSSPSGIPGQKVIVMNQQKVGYATPIATLTSPLKPQPNTSLLLSSLQNSKSNRIVISSSADSTLTSQSNTVVKVLGSNNINVNPQLQASSQNKPNNITSLKANASNEIHQGSDQIPSNDDLNHILKMNEDAVMSSTNVDGKGDKFELTTGYIQTAISNALKTENLSPEIEQKLIALKEHNDKDPNKHISRKERKNAIDPETGELMDDEWDPSGTKTRYIRKKMEKDKVITNAEGTENTPATNTSSSDAENPDFSHEKHPSSKMEDLKNASEVTLNQSPSVIRHSPPSLDSVTRDTNNPSSLVDGRKSEPVNSELQDVVNRQNDLLIQDIGKKRVLQEEELQVEIQQEIDTLKDIKDHDVDVNKSPDICVQTDKTENNAQDEFGLSSSSQEIPNILNKEHDPSNHIEDFIQPQTSDAIKNISNCDDNGRKRRRSKSGDISSPNVDIPPRKKRKSISNSLPSKKDKLHCVCQTKYDSTKFYVGCDLCNEWFHGSCVGITIEKANTMTEYICKGCITLRDNQEIFCLCKQPYDHRQYYIGCEKCFDWFHGHCVGILQSEADNIDKYYCPVCVPNSYMNRCNFKPLLNKHQNLLKNLVRQLKGNRYAAPFKEPVNPALVPNYYTVIKEPMDLQKIDQRIGQKYYKTLGKFIGDVMRIFENCRFFNPEHSLITKNADHLESYFIQKLSVLREKVAASGS